MYDTRQVKTLYRVGFCADKISSSAAGLRHTQQADPLLTRSRPGSGRQKLMEYSMLVQAGMLTRAGSAPVDGALGQMCCPETAHAAGPAQAAPVLHRSACHKTAQGQSPNVLRQMKETAGTTLSAEHSMLGQSILNLAGISRELTRRVGGGLACSFCSTFPSCSTTCTCYWAKRAAPECVSQLARSNSSQVYLGC